MPFTAQRFSDGRVSSWYFSQHVEVLEVKPSRKGGRYGAAYGFYYRNGERANAREDGDVSWCKIDDTTPQEIHCAACGSWVLLDILGEPTVEPVKVYSINDVLEKGKHQGETLVDVIHSDWSWVKWANENSSHFLFDVDKVIEEHETDIRTLYPKDVLTFGKYIGETIKQIANKDMRYVVWLADNSEDLIISFERLYI